MKLMPYTTTGFLSLRDAMDKLFQDSVIRSSELFSGPIPVDLYETGEAFTLKAAVPGVKPEELWIDATRESVLIKGELKATTEVKDEQYLRQELRYGTFQRTFTLPTLIQPEKVVATFENGIVTLTLPKAEEVKPKHITVKAKV